MKEYFLNYVENYPKKEYYSSSSEKFMKKFFGDDYVEKRQKEIAIHDEEDPSAPMYRNGSGYKNIDIENNKINSLTVHYYMGG